MEHIIDLLQNISADDSVHIVNELRSLGWIAYSDTFMANDLRYILSEDIEIEDNDTGEVVKLRSYSDLSNDDIRAALSWITDLDTDDMDDDLSEFEKIREYIWNALGNQDSPLSDILRENRPVRETEQETIA